MKILAVSNGYVPAWVYGGPIQSVHELCQGLIESGEDVTVYTTNINGRESLDTATSQRATVDSVPVHYFDVHRLKRFGFSMELTKELKRTLKKFDLVHIQGIFVYPCLVTARLCQKLGVPYVTTPRGVLDPYCLEYRGLKKRIYYLLAEKRNLDGARLIHFTSNEEQERASRLKLKAPSAVVPNCVDIRRFAALPSKGRFRSRYPNIKGRKILLFLGRIHFKKGLDLLIEAFRNLIPKYPDWCLVIAGSDDGGYQRRAMSQILEAGISQHVIFTGLVVGEQKLELFADSDLFALPSYNENFGMSVVEAMAAGLPVVISDQVQIWTDVKEAQAGMICPCETQGLQEAIEKLIQDSSLRERMGGNGKLLVQQKYSTDTVVPQMRELYRKALR